jgi:four helix bundle protein
MRNVRKGSDVAERLLGVVECVRRRLPTLPPSSTLKHVTDELWRSVTGAGANYEEARSSESTADFIHKIRVATKELRDALYWLRVIQRSDWVAAGSLDEPVDELDQLIAILIASARTARSRL